MESSQVMNAYADHIGKILEKFRQTQGDALDQAADRIVEAFLAKKRFLVIGSGHSHMIAEEFYARAGGLAFCTPMLQNELSLTDHPLKSTLIERTLDMASVYLELYHVEAGDVLLIVSNSGRNAMPVEMAKLAKAKGLTVMVMVNVAQTKNISSRHPDGKNLDAYADVLIDNCGSYGDAGFDVGEGMNMGSSSTIVGALAAQTISILVALKLKEKGLELPVFRSSNLDGADDYNKALFARFCKSY